MEAIALVLLYVVCSLPIVLPWAVPMIYRKVKGKKVIYL